jgi:hypothetical protein
MQIGTGALDAMSDLPQRLGVVIDIACSLAARSAVSSPTNLREQ